MSQVGLVNQMVTEVAASMSEMVRDVMDQVVESHKAILASLSRLEDAQQAIRDDLVSLADATGDEFTDIATLTEERSEWAEERLFDLAKRVAYLTGLMTFDQPRSLPVSGNGKPVPGAGAANGTKRPGAAHGRSSAGKPAGLKSLRPESA